MWAQKHFTEKKSFEEVLKTPDAAILFNKELLKIAQKERLRPHEIPLGVILVPEPLLKGDDRKIMRHQLEKQFQKEISETYERLGEEPQKNTPINNVNNPNNEEIVQRIMKMLDELGISSPEADPNSM
jgi:thymidylate kinase